MNLAQDLKGMRQLRGYSLREVEKATGISNAYLSQLERSRAKNPSPKVLAKLADCYGVRYESLLRAAGYLQTEDTSDISSEAIDLVAAAKQTPEDVSPFQQLILDAELDPDDQKLVAEYIAFLRSRKK